MGKVISLTFRVCLPFVFSLVSAVAAFLPANVSPSEGKVLFTHPAAAAVTRSYGELLTAWHRRGMKGETLFHLSRQNGFFDPAGYRPDTKKLVALLVEGRFAEINRLSTPLPFRENLFTSQNFLRAAYELGFIRELIWILPRERSMKRKHFEALKKYYTEEVDARSGDSLRFHNGVIEGFFLGMPVRICTLHDLGNLTLQSLTVHIDMNFFTAWHEVAPSDKTPLGILSSTVTLLREKTLNANAVQVSSSFFGGFSPLYHAFLEDALLPLLKNPERLERPVDPLWMTLNDMLEMERLGARKDALKLAEKASSQYPGYAYPYYFAAVIGCRRKEKDRCIDFARRAYAQDPRYIDGFLELSIHADRAGESDFARRLLEEALRLNADNYLALYMLGNLAYREKDCREAISFYRRFTEVLAEFGDITELIENCRKE